MKRIVIQMIHDPTMKIFKITSTKKKITKKTTKENNIIQWLIKQTNLK